MVIILAWTFVLLNRRKLQVSSTLQTSETIGRLFETNEQKTEAVKRRSKVSK